jgi:hypothetical protein
MRLLIQLMNLFGTFIQNLVALKARDSGFGKPSEANGTSLSYCGKGDKTMK